MVPHRSWTVFSISNFLVSFFFFPFIFFSSSSEGDNAKHSSSRFDFLSFALPSVLFLHYFLFNLLNTLFLSISVSLHKSLTHVITDFLISLNWFSVFFSYILNSFTGVSSTFLPLWSNKNVWLYSCWGVTRPSCCHYLCLDGEFCTSWGGCFLFLSPLKDCWKLYSSKFVSGA